jgi:hypothetical protein
MDRECHRCGQDLSGVADAFCFACGSPLDEEESLPKAPEPAYVDSSAHLLPDQLGELIAEFKNETAQPSLVTGIAICSAGVLALAAQKLLDLHVLLTVGSISWILMGLIPIAVGLSLKSNRLQICSEGVVQLIAGRSQCCRWSDVREILVEKQYTYASGICSDVRFHCRLLRNDGTTMNVHAVTITPRILKLLHDRWEMASGRRTDRA